eukprot:scaffold1754_cov180-Ochromonas_danica.AAC.5
MPVRSMPTSQSINPLQWGRAEPAGQTERIATVDQCPSSLKKDGKGHHGMETGQHGTDLRFCDGNFHVLIFFKSGNPNEVKIARQLADQMATRAIMLISEPAFGCKKIAEMQDVCLSFEQEYICFLTTSQTKPSILLTSGIDSNNSQNGIVVAIMTLAPGDCCKLHHTVVTVESERSLQFHLLRGSPD